MPLNALKARELAQRALDRALGPRGLVLAPPLPERWPPPGPDAAVVYAAYLTRSLPTGASTAEVHSPEALVRILLADGTVHVTRAAPRRLLDRTTPIRQSIEDLAPAADALLRVVSGGGRAGDPALVAAAYRTWAADHAALAAELRPRFPDFFDWLSRTVS